MAYNKAKAEQEWLRKKEAEEQQLRELGMDEEKIQLLRAYDWEEFNHERQYQQRRAEWPVQIAQVPAQQIELSAETVQALLDRIDDVRLENCFAENVGLHWERNCITIWHGCLRCEYADLPSQEKIENFLLTALYFACFPGLYSEGQNLPEP